VIAFLIDHKINAIRLPFSLEFALTPMDVQEAKAGGGFGELQYPDRGKISPAYYGYIMWLGWEKNSITYLCHDSC